MKSSQKTKNRGTTKGTGKFKRIPLNALGRPTKYKKIYAQWMLEYFDKKPYEYKTFKGEKGGLKVIRYPVDFPTLEEFASFLNVDTDTIGNWANAKDPSDPEGKKLLHPEFFGVYKKCKEFQKKILVTNGLTGDYVSNFAIFVATNLTDMKDKKEVDNNISSEGEVVGFTYIIPKDTDNDTDTGDSTSLTTDTETTPSQIDP